MTKVDLAELIRRGVHITHQAQENDIAYDDNPEEAMHNAFKDFHLWKMDVRDYFLKHNLDAEAQYFLEADEVPMLKGGIEYSDAASPKSQKLLKSIREETVRRLAFLREFSKGMKKDVRVNGLFLFYLSRKKGLWRVRNDNEEIYPVHRSKYRFSILDNLTKEYRHTKELAKLVDTKPQNMRAQIAGMKQRIEKHFPGILGNDFIQGEQSLGYRLGEKIVLKKQG